MADGVTCRGCHGIAWWDHAYGSPGREVDVYRCSCGREQTHCRDYEPATRADLADDLADEEKDRWLTE